MTGNGFRNFVAAIDGALVAAAGEHTHHPELLERLNLRDARVGRGFDEVACGYLIPDGETLYVEAGTLPKGMTNSSLLCLLRAELPGHRVISAADQWKFG